MSRQLSIAASPNGTARLSEDPAGDEGKPVYRSAHWCSLPKRKEKATVATDAEHARKKSKAAQTGEDVPFSIYSVFDEIPGVGSPSSNVGVIPEDKLSDGTRQNPHDADGDLNGVAAIASGEMREPMMSDSRRYNHWEDDDYNRYLSDLFWDDMFDTAPWMREA